MQVMTARGSGRWERRCWWREAREVGAGGMGERASGIEDGGGGQGCEGGEDQ